MMKNEPEENVEPVTKSKTRLYIGIIVLILALTMPIWGTALVSVLGLSPGISTVLIGLSIAGGPDLLLLIAAAVMGKDALNQILGQIGKWFKRNFKLSENVSKKRYILGLIAVKGSTDWGLIILIGFEVVFVISIFVLGANFWEKLGALFRWNTRVVTIEEQTE
jgi:hypothetical protein